MKKKQTDNQTLTIPSLEEVVQAGFPSPAEGLIEEEINLHQMMVKRPAATFFVRVAGESMREAGIFPGDLLVVDRSLTPANGKIVVAVIEGEFTVKRLKTASDGIYLCPENSAFCEVKIKEEMDFQVWGVVTYVIHKAK